MSDIKENSAPASSGAAPHHPHPGKTKFRYYTEQFLQLLVALLVVFAIRSSVVEPFKIPSGSMIPTLYVGDFIFVNKFAYGFKLPFSDLFGNAVTLFERAPPKNGDIVVFIYPKDPSYYYIKRVIGIPGDTVEVKNKVLFINGQEASESEVDSAFKQAKLEDIGDVRYGMSHMKMMKETVGGKEHFMMTDTGNEFTSNFGPITVPSGNLFVMGDNRDFSNDSRFWGFVPMENVAGRAEVIWLSLWVNFNEPGRSTFKPSRIGTLLN